MNISGRWDRGYIRYTVDIASRCLTEGEDLGSHFSLPAETTHDDDKRYFHICSEATDWRPTHTQTHLTIFPNTTLHWREAVGFPINVWYWRANRGCVDKMLATAVKTITITPWMFAKPLQFRGKCYTVRAEWRLGLYKTKCNGCLKSGSFSC